ncbi:FMN-binding negative transcriptional regulator [Streptomyces sp. NPDC051217]|uniref:FMN-binding negative transcriptional regulator n=1 Tax=Streptomyces sp. NPDC051217 TaxID=3365644 RepID=UPI0037B50FA2
MHVPDVYQAREGRQLVDVVSQHPLAALITNGPFTPFSTHLPMIPASDAEADELVGSTLLGHMNRVNPHWSALLAGTPAKAVFWGPNSYVTPMLYAADPSAPTWNFVSVHVEGVLRPIRDDEETFEVVRRTASRLERLFGAGWELEGSLDYFRKIVPGVGAFTFDVHSAQGMFKLSQDKEPAIRRRIFESLEADGTGLTRELGKAMRSFDEGGGGGSR